MAETKTAPDFEAIARFCLNLTPGGGLAGTHLTPTLLIEKFREVWNARGAADMKLLTEEYDEAPHDLVAEAIRSLDR